MACFAEYISPIGPLILLSDNRALTGLRLGQFPSEGAVPGADTPVLAEARAWLDAYFRGENAVVSFPLAPEGTEFQKTVWNLLLKIPKGEIRTYGEIAQEMAGLLGREKMSAQAIGQAVGRNPIGIVIPCHRVLGAGGRLTGYAWGLETKQWLLRHENAVFIPEALGGETDDRQ